MDLFKTIQLRTTWFDALRYQAPDCGRVTAWPEEKEPPTLELNPFIPDDPSVDGSPGRFEFPVKPYDLLAIYMRPRSATDPGDFKVLFFFVDGKYNVSQLAPSLAWAYWRQTANKEAIDVSEDRYTLEIRYASGHNVSINWDGRREIMGVIKEYNPGPDTEPKVSGVRCKDRQTDKYVW